MKDRAQIKSVYRARCVCGSCWDFYYGPESDASKNDRPSTLGKIVFQLELDRFKDFSSESDKGL